MFWYARTPNTYTVGFDDTHVMTVDPEVELSERSHVEDPETVSLSGLQKMCEHHRQYYSHERREHKVGTNLERQCSIFVESHSTGNRIGVCTFDRSEVLSTLRKVHYTRVCMSDLLGTALTKYSESLTGNGLGTTGVGDADELLQENRVLIVVPVTEEDTELPVVLVSFLWRVNN